jgi:acetolactate synthase-1/2/3 large subunit
MKASDYIIDFLVNNGIGHVFYMIGGAITHLVDSSNNNKNISFITMHHEQGAAFAAEGYARIGGMGVAMATSGPGATNLITSIGSCFFDSIPCLFITGQVNTYEYKFDLPVRQIGFQETDIVSIVKPITKGAKLVKRAEDLRHDLEWAIHLAKSGRPGPVLLDIPMNIQRTEIDPKTMAAFTEPKPNDDESKNLEKSIEYILNSLDKAKRPVVLVGGGARIANACEELFKFIDQTKIPIVSSLMGKDAFPHEHPAYAGMIGAYGNRCANFITANADLLLILGSRLDTRQTGTKPNTFAREANIIQIDADANELNRSVKTQHAVHADLYKVMTLLNQKLQNHTVKVSNTWLDYVKNCKANYFDNPDVTDSSTINPGKFIAQLSPYLDDDAIITVDVGQHQMWVAQSLKIKKNQRLLISGGMGAMGFALPAAIGAAFKNPNKQIIVIAGDGGIQLNIQELQTIVRNKLNIKIIIMNNGCLGMVRQFQEIYFNAKTTGTLDGYSDPNFAKIFSAYGLATYQLNSLTDIGQVVPEFLKAKKASLLEVMLPPTTIVEPKLIVNDPIEDQDPKLPLDEFQKLMLISPVSR